MKNLTVEFQGQTFKHVGIVIESKCGNEYYAYATGPDDNEYQITWKTTAAWKRAERAFELQKRITELSDPFSLVAQDKNELKKLKCELAELESIIKNEDDSEPCDWKFPDSVDKICQTERFYSK